jgi:hypothetical protein
LDGSRTIGGERVEAELASDFHAIATELFHAKIASRLVSRVFTQLATLLSPCTTLFI